MRILSAWLFPIFFLVSRMIVFRLCVLACTEELSLEFLYMKFLLLQWVMEQGSVVNSGASI